jgi:hypothetical protein
MAEGLLAEQPLAHGAAAIGSDQLGVGSGLVDEDQRLRVKACLAGLPALARFGHLGPRLLAGVQRFL